MPLNNTREGKFFFELNSSYSAIYNNRKIKSQKEIFLLSSDGSVNNASGYKDIEFIDNRKKWGIYS